MRRLLLVANPAASGFTASLHRDVVEILQRTYDVTPVWPNGPKQARSRAASASADGFEVVAAMGGDGVIHQVANGLIGTPAALGIIPAGTTNVLRRIAGFPAKPRDAAEGLAASVEVEEMATMALTAGDGNKSSSHVVTFAAGVGFDAEVIRESERRPMRKVGFGQIHYARSAAKVVLTGFRNRRPSLEVSDGSQTVPAVAVQLQVHDQFTYLTGLPLRLGGGPKPIAAIIEKITTRRMVSVIARAAVRGDLTRVPGVHVWEGFENITVSASEPEWVEADGELLGSATTITAAPEPRPLLVAALPG